MSFTLEYIFTAFDYYSPGGTVMILIIMVSVWMWSLIFDRLLFFKEMEQKDINIKEALSVLKNRFSIPKGTGACGSMMKGFLSDKTGDAQQDKKILDQHSLIQERRLKRSLQLITVLAAAAPMMGLLGTVTGMVSTFDVISLFGTGNARALSGGISEALITTQSGLLVGIPGLFMGRLLKHRSEKLSRRLKKTVMALSRNL